MKTLRDFIYVDADRLYSLYSQVFEGVADAIVQSYIAEMSTSGSDKTGMFRGGVATSEAAERTTRTENRLLYDHMYSQLEDRLRGALLEINASRAAPPIDTLANIILVKVRGLVELEDYGRLNQILENFNKLGEAITYSGLSGTGILEAKEALERAAQSTRDRNKRAVAKRTADQVDLKALAKQAGLHQDERLLANIQLLSELFNKDGLEVTVVPQESIVFRGVLDRKWLRTAPERLRALHGTYPAGEWTMVGLISHVPGQRALPTAAEAKDAPSADPESPSMRDPFRNMFLTSAVFERMFLQSTSRTEVVVAPIAIYREFGVDALENAVP